MTYADFSITITPAQVEKWRSELTKIRDQQKKLEQQASLLEARIGSVQFYLEPDQRQLGFPEIDKSHGINKPQQRSAAGEIKDMEPSEAVRTILLQASAPITKAELKTRLKIAGYPMDRLGKWGAYLHTIVKRLRKSGKVGQDGDKLWLNR